MNIVTLTLNPALDKSTETEQLIPEQKLRCSPMRIDAGGGGINVSKGVSKLGGKSIAVFPVAGHNGQVLRQLVEAQNITTQVIELSGETRENIAVTATHTNQQFRFTLPGNALDPKDADRCLQLIENIKPQYLVASGSLPPGLPAEYFEKVAAFAKTIGARFILDTSGAALAAAADEGLFLLKPNIGELAALVGSPKLEMNEVDDAALEIIRQGKCEVVVVSLGPQGALLVTRDGFEHVPAPMVDKKSTVGAGDSMVSGMVWALAQGMDFRQMARWGVACGSAATMNAGTQLFEVNDVRNLLKWIKMYGERYRFRDF
ncbi:MAG: 1-phosphofructokinase family hexose kinase [Saprospiraceae bacterium]|nr:1-phosphofructokinase family hexose kinase [Saprospiraceae bacterium]